MNNQNITHLFNVANLSFRYMVQEPRTMFISLNGGESTPHEYRDFISYYKPLIMMELQQTSQELKYQYSVEQ